MRTFHCEAGRAKRPWIWKRAVLGDTGESRRKIVEPVCRSLLWAFALLLGLTVPVHAALRQMNTRDLVAACDDVVHGRVVYVHPQWDRTQGSIVTEVVIEPIEHILVKGRAADSIALDVPGGIVGDVGLCVPDAPEFILGEEVVLFLKDEDFGIAGWRQGKYSVEGGIVQREGVPYAQFREKILAVAQGREAAGYITRDAHAVLDPALLSYITKPVRIEDRSAADAVVVMSEDFEGAFPAGSWSLVDQSTSDGGEYLWGSEDYLPYTGSYSMWPAGGGADSLDAEADNYPDNMDTWAIYGPFDLSDAHAAEMRFYRRTINADFQDRLYWYASGDGVHFTGYMTTGVDGWREQTLDLADVGGTSLIGDDSVWIAFRFVSGSSGGNKGAFIDDVVVEKRVGEGPVVFSYSSDTGPSGAGFSVKIQGARFGSSQGDSEVRFTGNPGEGTYVNPGSVIDWSNAGITCEVPQGASSGPVSVIVGGKTAVGPDFTVTFGAGSHRWGGERPMGEHFRVNANATGVADVLGAVISAMQAWNTAGGAAFSFSYGGTTDAEKASYNGENEICWGSLQGAPAASHLWFDSGTGEILETDVVFADDEPWAASSPVPGNCYDVQAVATHELGLCLGLRALYGAADQGKTMFGLVSSGDEGPSTLESVDAQGIQYLYGTAAVNIVSTTLPDAEVGAQLAETLVAVGGLAPYTWATWGDLPLPPGLSLSSDGAISGIPTTPGLYQFNVRVTDSESQEDSQVFQMMTGDATGPDISVIHPNGGEILEVGDTYEITWGAWDYNGVDSVSIYYSAKGGSSYDTVATGEPNDGSFEWTVPPSVTRRALVRIVAYDGFLNGSEDVSDSLFTITDRTDPAVAVLAPNGGEVYYTGCEHAIAWSATDAAGVDVVGIYYSTSNGSFWTTVASAADNDGQYRWTVPGLTTDHALVRVRAVDPSRNVGEDVSDGSFRIVRDVTPPAVTLNAPNGGEVWYADSTYAISWSAADDHEVDSVSVYYSLDGGGRYDMIAAGGGSDSSCTWTVPRSASSSVVVKVVASDPSDNTAFDTSDGLFSITTLPDLTPPELLIGLHQNPELTSQINVYLASSEALQDTSIWLAVGDSRLDASCTDTVRHIYRGSYQVGTTGVTAVRAGARDLAGNPAEETRPFAVGLFKASDGGLLTGPGGHVSLSCSPNSVERDCYLLLVPEPGHDENPGGHDEFGFTLSPPSLRLAHPAGITASLAREGGGLTLWRQEAWGWEEVESNYDALTGTLSALIDRLGSFKVVRDDQGADGVRSRFVVRGVPNPFTKSTALQYYVPAGGAVRLSLYDAIGRLVRVLYEGPRRPGWHSERWDGRDLRGRAVPSGVYLVEIRAGAGAAKGKVALVRK
jgi:hypothetical protein